MLRGASLRRISSTEINSKTGRIFSCARFFRHKIMRYPVQFFTTCKCVFLVKSDILVVTLNLLKKKVKGLISVISKKNADISALKNTVEKLI